MLWGLRLAVRGFAGGLLLWGFNAVAGVFDFHIGLNPASALAVGLLGVPGLVLLALVRVLLA